MKKSGTLRLLAGALTLALMAGAAPAAWAEDSLNSAPVAQSLSLTTYRGVQVCSEFKSIDPEGDQVAYTVAREPGKGTVEVDGASFTYTPKEGKKGRDTFTYVASDTAGNVSNEATVTVEIKKQNSGVTYSDTSGELAYPALALAEAGILVGQRLGGSWVFEPERTVSRGEFLVMCMDLTGTELLEGVTRTGFYDDGVIPDWQKPYVTTALTCGVITGSAMSDGRVIFAPEDGITVAEAAVMLDNAIGTTDVSFETAEYVPAWAAQACANLRSCGVLEGQAAEPDAVLTRAEAAMMLTRAMEVLEGREEESLLAWAWRK